jgi:hypothetical protein
MMRVVLARAGAAVDQSAARPAVAASPALDLGDRVGVEQLAGSSLEQLAASK